MQTVLEDTSLNFPLNSFYILLWCVGSNEFSLAHQFNPSASWHFTRRSRLLSSIFDFTLTEPISLHFNSSHFHSQITLGY